MLACRWLCWCLRESHLHWADNVVTEEVTPHEITCLIRGTVANAGKVYVAGVEWAAWEKKWSGHHATWPCSPKSLMSFNQLLLPDSPGGRCSYSRVHQVGDLKHWTIWLTITLGVHWRMSCSLWPLASKAYSWCFYKNESGAGAMAQPLGLSSQPKTKMSLITVLIINSYTFLYIYILTMKPPMLS